MRHLPVLAAFCLCTATITFADGLPGVLEQSPEDFKLEAFGSLWILDTGGTVHGNGTTGTRSAAALSTNRDASTASWWTLPRWP